MTVMVMMMVMMIMITKNNESIFGRSFFLDLVSIRSITSKDLLNTSKYSSISVLQYFSTFYELLFLFTLKTLLVSSVEKLVFSGKI